MKKKFILIIKMISFYSSMGILLQALLLNMLLASDNVAQEVKSVKEVFINVNIDNASLEKTFEILESFTNFTFAYEKEDLNPKVRVNIIAKNKSLEKVLLEISEISSLRFRQVNLGIDVKKAEKPNKKPAEIEVVIQSRRISGKVTTMEDGEELPGVNVIEKGTTNGTVTDVQGNYSLEVSENATLVFSSVGYTREEVEVGNQSVIDLVMNSDIKQLQELIVVGYGTMQKSDLTGAINKVEVEKLNELPNVGIMQSLQGSVPGLNIGAVDNSGENPTFSIRGQNTLSSSAGANAPLIVVDGIIYRGNLIDINTADVESVEILKDASSAAIYGSQASNGVILITTKKGKGAEKPIISYSGQYSLQTPSNKLEPMNGAEYEEFLTDVLWEQSRLGPDYLSPNPDFSLSPFFKTQGITQGYENGLDNDWWDLLTNNGHLQSHNISVRGQTESLNYFVSGGLLDQQGFIENDSYERINIRANLDVGVTDWLSVGFESFLASSDYSGVSPSIGYAFHLQPYAPIYEDDGSYVLEPENGLNPFLQVQIDDNDKRFNLFGNFHTDIKLPFLEGFNYRINYSHNYRTDNHDNFNRWGANYTGSGYKNTFTYYDWTFDNIISYVNSFNVNHRVNLTLVYGVEKRDFRSTETSAQKFTNMVLGYNKLEAGDPTLFSINTGAEEESSLYTMGRLFYSFMNKYMITGTVRRDGFSGFGTNDKTGVFPSVALGWIASEENFFQNNMGSWFDYLKLRASYGTTARRGLGRYETLAQLSIAPSRVFGDGGSTTIGQWISSMANNELGWETTTGLNLGFDFGFIDSRINGTFEYYNNNTSDILYNIQIPYLTGFSSIATNIGEVYNHGIELSLNGQVVNTSAFKWDASINFSRNRNEIKSILGVDNDGDGQEDDIISNQLFIGEPQNVVYDYNIIGMWQLADEEDIPNGFLPGTYKIADVNEDGDYGPDDRQILGYRDPSYRFGIANTFNFKNFSLYTFINSIQGGKNYYYGDGSPYSDGNHQKQDQLTYSNVPGWDYWMPENPNAKYRRLDTPSNFAPRPYDQRNFVRLQDVSLAYNFSPEFLEKLNFNNLKIYLSGKNLMTITDWEGWDPETGVGIAAGLPVMRSYTLGLNVEF